MMGKRACIFIEHRGGAVKNVVFEIAGRLGELGCDICGLVLAADEDSGKQVARKAATIMAEVFILVDEAFSSYDSLIWGRQTADFIGRLGAEGRDISVVAAGSTPMGKDLLAGASARLGRGFCSDCLGLDMADDGSVTILRPYYGGKVHGRVLLEGPGPHFVTVRPNTFSAAKPVAQGAAISVKKPEPAQDAPKTAVIESRTASSEKVDIAEADIVVCGGRGIKEKDNFHIVEKLANAVGGVPAASRAVVDAGWRDLSEQVGKSGKTISASLYIGVGVSGAVHHIMGMDACKHIVVINSDEGAEFFKHADIGVVGDLNEVVPALIEELK